MKSRSWRTIIKIIIKNYLLYYFILLFNLLLFWMRALTHSSWFKVAAFNMKDFEVLSHGTCLLLNVPNRMPSFWMVGSGHVSFPFKFPGLYGKETWLTHVTENDKYDQIEIRDNVGGVKDVFRVFPRALHPSRDLVIASFFNEEDSKIIKESLSEDVILNANTDSLKMDDIVHFEGFEVENSGMENEIHQAKRVSGKINIIANKRYFAKTDETLKMGLCGGPVLNDKGECVGILEGTVNPPNERQEDSMKKFSEEYEGSALFVPINEALEMIYSHSKLIN